MNYKSKRIIIGIFFILIIQILLIINNKQKTSFRYFIWNIEEVSIGRLIFISFISGILTSSLLDKTMIFDLKSSLKNEKENKTNAEKINSFDSVDNEEAYDIPPERDLRDTQPTISVNYRVIKDKGDNSISDKKRTSKNSEYKDDWDWDNNDSDW